MLSKKIIASRNETKENLSLAERFIREKFSQVYRIIGVYHDLFPDKPKFVFFDDGRGNVFVVREDYMSQIERTNYNPGVQVTISEYEAMRYYDEEALGYPVTCHTVFVNEHLGVVTKLGNPYRDRAPLEFLFALQNKYFRGLVELEVPLGFMVNMEHPDSTQEEGKTYIYYPGQQEPNYTRMFYKHINGRSLDHLLREKPVQELNWILWEIAKLFSRLLNFKILFKDSHRWNNFYIEIDRKGQQVLRLLDSEFIIPKENISQSELEYMLFLFIEAALEKGLIDWERMDDFLMVCLGDPWKVKEVRDYLKRDGGKTESKQLDFWEKRR